MFKYINVFIKFVRRKRKQFFNKFPFKSAKRYYYLNSYENYKLLLNFLNSSNFKHFQKTETKIFFRGNIEFGLSKKEVKKIIGKPLFKLKNKEIKHHEVYYYKWRFSGYKMKAEIHFFDNKFFVGNYKINDCSEETYKKISSKLIEKYKLNEELLSCKKFAFSDDLKSTVIAQHMFNLSLTYFNGNEAIIQNILKITESFEKQIKNEKRKNNDFLKHL